MRKKIDLSKYKKIAHFLEITMQTFFYVGLLGCFITLLLGIVFLFIPDTNPIFNPSNISSIKFSLDGLLSYNITPETISSANVKTILTTIMFMASIIAIILTPIFRQLSLILGTIKVDKPFAKENGKRLSTIAIIFLLSAFIIKIPETFVAMVIVNKLGLHNMNVNFSVDTTMLLMGLMLLILSGIFKYGAYLQKEYDSMV